MSDSGGPARGPSRGSAGPSARRVSPRVYRRRRFVALAGVVVLLVVVVALVAHAAGSGHPAASAGSRSSPASGRPVASATATPVPSASAASGQPALCEAADITVSAITNSTSYAAGVSPELSLSVTNHGSVACRINVGTAQQVFTITSSSGSQVYWKSTDCQTGATNSEITLDPGKTLTSGTPLSWDREASDPATCGGARSAVPAGGATYALQTSVDGFMSSNVAKFTLN